MRKTQELLPYFSDGKRNLETFTRTKENFPQEIMFFTTNELGIMAFNKLKDESYFVGISGIPKKVDSSIMNSFAFFTHDLGHIDVIQSYYHGGIFLPQEIYERIENISNRRDREEAELAFFLYRHELPGFLSDIKLRLREYYAGAGTNFSQSKLRQLKADTKKSARFMMLSNKGLFRYHKGRLHMMLPDSVNVNDEKEVEKFLVESADIFADILLGF